MSASRRESMKKPSLETNNNLFHNTALIFTYIKLSDFFGGFMIKFRAAVAITVAMLTFTGCTTANYGSKPVVVGEEADTYKFKVYVGGFAGPETAFNSAKEDIAKFQKENHYAGYKVIGKEYNVLPSYFEYTVKFTRTASEPANVAEPAAVPAAAPASVAAPQSRKEKLAELKHLYEKKLISKETYKQQQKAILNGQ